MSLPQQPSMPRDQWTYTVISAVFAVCLIAVPYMLSIVAGLLFSKGNTQLVLKNTGSMLTLFVVICGATFVFGTVSGLIVGLIVELVTRKKKFNPIVSAALGGAMWGGLTGFIVLIVPIVISVVLIITIGAALPMIAAIIVMIPFSSLYFALTIMGCRLLAKRRVLKIYHIFFLALGIAVIYCAILPILFLLYLFIETLSK